MFYSWKLLKTLKTWRFSESSLKLSAIHDSVNKFSALNGNSLFLVTLQAIINWKILRRWQRERRIVYEMRLRWIPVKICVQLMRIHINNYPKRLTLSYVANHYVTKSYKWRLVLIRSMNSRAQVIDISLLFSDTLIPFLSLTSLRAVCPRHCNYGSNLLPNKTLSPLIHSQRLFPLFILSDSRFQ